MLYTNLETNTKNKLNLKYPKNKVRILSLTLFIAGTLFIGTRLFAADTINWSFDSAQDYQLSDTNKIELASGEVKLKQVASTLTDDTQGEFDGGTHLNTTYTNGSLALGTTNLSTPITEAGLVAQYRLENNVNDQKGLNNGVQFGGFSYVTGQVGSAGSFDGTDDNVTVFNNFGFTGTNLTMEAWVNLDSTSEKGVIVKVGGGNNGGVAMGVGSNTMDVAGNDLIILYEGVHWFDTNIPIGTGWHHIATVVNSAGDPTVYIDGIPKGAYSGYDALAPVDNAIVIGGYVGRYVDAYIDEVSIYTTDLSADRILSNYNRNIARYGEFNSKIIDTTATEGVTWNEFNWTSTSPTSKELPNSGAAETTYSTGNVNMSGNLGLWHLNNNFNDSSGNGLTGVGQNGVAFNSGYLGTHGAVFDGSNDHVSLGNSGTLITATVTVSSWVRTTSNDNMYIFSKKGRKAGGWHAYALNIGPSWASSTAGQVSARIQMNSTPSFVDFKTTRTVNDGKWHHIVLTYSSDRIGRIYVDGVLEATSGTGANTISYFTNANAYIGGSMYCTTGDGCTENTLEGPFNGNMDELAVFNKGLTQQEVLDLYNRGANKLNFQIRACDDNVCNGENFVGPDGSSNTYFSELTNTSLTLPNFNISNLVGRYLQYKVILQTDSANSKPSIVNVNSKIGSYALDKPSVSLINAEDLGAIPAVINVFCEGTIDINDDCTTNSTKPANTEIYHQICNDTVLNCNTINIWKYWDGNSWENANSTQFSTASDINANIQSFVPQSQHFTFKSFLSTGGQSTPVLKDISISAEIDTAPPVTNASEVSVSGKNSGDWIISKPTIGWTTGSDDTEGIGLLGYCISLDESNIDTTQNLNPAISGGLLHSLNDGVSQSYCPFIVTGNSVNLNNIVGLTLQTNKEYNFSIKAVDASGNIWNGSSEDYQDLFTFRYDGTTPTNPAFISMPSNFVQSKDVTITWPTDPTNGAGDVGAGLAGLQYRIGSNGTWYGDLHNGNQDLTDLLVNDGAYTTSEEFDYPNMIDGSNIIYFRAIDNAGNVASSSVTGALKINSTAPGQVQNLQVTPTDSTTNSYGFSWEIPDTFIGEANGLTYCYSVNTLPNANNCTYTQAGVTSIPADAYASQPGTNNFYIVARDEASNINYATYTSVQFTYSGEAPGIPLNFDVSDLSVKETEDWKLAVTWAAPTNVGAGVSNYKVFRSSNASASCNVSMLNFTQVSTVLGTSYIDTNLEQQDYYYCVKACDSANNCSAPSSTDVQYPTGKYTEPAVLISGPTVNTVTTKKAVITWVTDRRSDSKIQIGLKTNEYFEAESAVSAQVTAHTVTLDNLVAGTTYYYRAKWTDEDGNTGISEEKSFTTSPPPSIIMTNVVNIGIDSALLQLRVSGTTNATILYGVNNSFNSIKELSTSFTESTYTVPLDGLIDNSRYTYKIILKDIEGAEYLNLETNEFTTLPRPLVSNISVEEIKNVAQPTVKVTWSSNTDVSSIVNYYPEANPSAVQDSVILDRVTNHEIILSGLLANTKYVLIVKGIDRFGNEAVSAPQVITTATDTRPPEISNIKVETVNPDSLENTSQIIVSWETDEVATSQVEYGEGTTGSYSQSTQVDRTFGYRHVVIITNLKPASVFHLRAISQDNSKNTTESMNIVTITPKQQESAFDIVLKGLADIFSFL